MYSEGSRLKIALVSEHASPLVMTGGQHVYVAQVARGLRRAGHQVDVFTRRDRALLPPVSYKNGGRIVNVPAGPPMQLPKELLLPHMPAFAEFLVDFCRNETPAYDVIHANYFMSGMAALEVKQALGIPLVTTFHELGRVRALHLQESAGDHFLDQRVDIEAELVRRADCLIAQSPADEADLIERYDADSSRIAMIASGFDPEEFSPVDRLEARARLHWTRDEFALVHVGRLAQHKGIDTIVRGIAMLQARYGVKAHLYVVGGEAEIPNEIATPEIARLRGVAHRCGIDERVTFVGRRERTQLRDFYCAANVFVTTPEYESSSIAPIEAMACGTPIIGSDVGGIRHSVRQGETGWLVPPRDPEALAERLLALHADSERARAMGEAGRLRAQTHFTWQHAAHQLESVYARLANVVDAGRPSAANADDDALRAVG